MNRTSLAANLPTHTADGRTTAYTYDPKTQLLQEQSTRAGGYTSNFGYDAAGNPTSFKGVPHVYNADNQDAANLYDGNGNPTTYLGSPLSFDPENRLTSVGAVVLTAGYTGEGLRAWKQTAGRSGWIAPVTCLGFPGYPCGKLCLEPRRKGSCRTVSLGKRGRSPFFWATSLETAS